MSQLALKQHFTADEYLAWEVDQLEKHEYYNGEVFAMAGASDAHVTVALNAAIALRQHLRGSPCSVFISDMRLYLSEDNVFFYPDVFVTCAAEDREQRHYKSVPLLIIEVLSPSTGAYDRGGKFAAYRRFTSLREYALIDLERISVDLFRRNAQDLWVLHPFAAGQQIELASIELSLPIAALYEDSGLPNLAPVVSD